VYHSTLGLTVIQKKKKKKTPVRSEAASSTITPNQKPSPLDAGVPECGRQRASRGDHRPGSDDLLADEADGLFTDHTYQVPADIAHN